MKINRHFLCKNTILMGILGFTLSIFSPVPAFSSDQQKNGENIREFPKFHEKRVDGNWVFLKKKVIIDASIDILANFIINVPLSVAIVPGLKKKNILKQFSETERIDYDHFTLPKPFKDRYLIYHAKQEYDTGREILFTLNSVDKYPLEDKDKILGVVRESSLLLQSLEEDGTKTNLTVIMQVDPRGFLPVWLINLNIDNISKKLFKKLQKNIQKEISKQKLTKTHWKGIGNTNQTFNTRGISSLYINYKS